MTSTPARGLLHLAAAISQGAVYGTEAEVEAVRLAERGGLDFVTLDDTSADPVTLLSRLASATTRIGLVPAATSARTEPGQVPGQARAAGAAPARTGRRIDAATAQDEARGDAREENARDDARDEKRDAGPCPPRDRPVRVIDATEAQARRAAALYADVVLVRVATAVQAAAVRDQVRRTAEESGRDPGALRILASLLVDLGDGEYAAAPGHGGGGPRQTAQGPHYRGGPVDLAELIATWHANGIVDGFHFTPVEPRRDLERLVNGTVALLQHRGLFRTFYPGSTLREHLDLVGRSDRAAVGGNSRLFKA
ncbi:MULTISPECIES: LLM class flavin-dependent oxidoreductase [Streptomyces]|uniref:LLM class flavin-dependent oxidoreductase n=1 Tax=Streptomyces spinosisporus TaxID=2927582 RepID=A0ABS9XNR9_9ACTN|nr:MULTISPECIES: LLM class flavin-dependent oxidoreductase [Streptomyces]MCI3243610.1 LLM class flavin-dependent oxidoreductase [Streptomyces spinosisporus]WUB39403.1 LLM class flavin-dependent oxidoreductase [Streptomyces sp. NBC_00588]